MGVSGGSRGIHIKEGYEMTQYRCKHFVIKELVNPTLLAKIGENVAWRLFDARVLKAADAIRKRYGAMVINTKDLPDCGLRDPLSTTGAKYSQHKLGNALDGHILSIEKAAAEIKDPVERKKFKIREYNKVREQLMLDSEFDCLSFEHNIPWLHFEVSNRENRLFNA